MMRMDDEAAAEPPSGGSAAPARRKRWIPRQVKWAIGIVAVFFVGEYLLLPELASARKTIDLLGEVNVIWIVLGVILEGVSLAAYAELSHTVLSPGAPHRAHPVPGQHVEPGREPRHPRGHGARHRGGLPAPHRPRRPGSTVAFGLATQGVGSAVVLNGIFWLALLVSIPLTGYNPLYGFAAIAGVILITLFAGTILLLTRGKRQAADLVERIARHVPLVKIDVVAGLVQKIADRLVILLRDRQLLTHALIWAAANWLLDAASLWVFVLAFGHVVSPVDLLVAYGLANVLAVIPITPGGLGVVEGILIPTLVGFHVPLGIATLGVLSYRLINFWLPIPVGGAAYLSLRFGPAGPPPDGVVPRRTPAPARAGSAGGGALGRPGLDLAPPAGPLDGQLLQPPLRVDTLSGRDAAPATVGPQHPGVGVVGEDEVEDLEQPRLQLGIAHRHQHLDPPVQVALHQVGRADVQGERWSTGPVAVPVPVGRVVLRPAEAVDARVLEELADHRAHPDRLGEAGDARAQAAQAAHGQVDRDAGARGAGRGRRSSRDRSARSSS